MLYSYPELWSAHCCRTRSSMNVRSFIVCSCKPSRSLKKSWCRWSTSLQHQKTKTTARARMPHTQPQCVHIAEEAGKKAFELCGAILPLLSLWLEDFFICECLESSSKDCARLSLDQCAETDKELGLDADSSGCASIITYCNGRLFNRVVRRVWAFASNTSSSYVSRQVSSSSSSRSDKVLLPDN